MGASKEAGILSEVVELQTLQASESSSSKDVSDPTVVTGVRAAEEGHVNGETEERVKMKSTIEDQKDMRRMGRSQELVREFHFMNIASFVAIATASWEIGIFVINQGLINGGSPALLYSILWCFVGFGPIYLSLSEMASMAPIAGSQYHWVSEFAPERYQRILSYYTGWTSSIAYQAGNALGVFLGGTLIQTIIQVNIPDYTYPNWHGMLLVWGVIGLTYAGNVWGSKLLAHWQNPVFVVHLLGFFALIIPIWVNAPKATSKQVWLDFEYTGGWSSVPLALMAGQLTGISAQTGVDTACHMSEEVRIAAKSVPKAMMLIYGLNAIIMFPALVTLCYHMPNVDAALNDITGYPAIHVLRNTMSVAWITALLSLIVFIIIAGNISYLAAVTRDLFAFARDDGLPFSRWISTIDPKRRIPRNAILLSSGIGVLLSLIYAGSPVAFYAINSLLTVALLQCYCTSIGCVLWRRIKHPETLPHASFSLGRWGVPLNAFAVVWGVWAFFWSFFPLTPVNAATGGAAAFNWASPIFIAVLIGATVHFWVSARHVYTGPVVLVEGRKPHES